MSERGFVNLRGTKEKPGEIGRSPRGNRILLVFRSALRVLPWVKYIDVPQCPPPQMVMGLPAGLGGSCDAAVCGHETGIHTVCASVK